jgi:hypothetical protein
VSSIDAEVVLALATKAAQVFEQDRTYLSIPLSPVAFRRERLAAMLSGQTAEGLRALGEFSRLVNAIPEGRLWSPLAERYLWDVYGDVLANADLPAASRTPAEEADYQRAFALLHHVGSEGLMTDSPVVTAYRQHRDAWLVALQEYNNQKGKADLSEDESVKAQWRDNDEPALRARVQDCEQRWATEGHRAEVEEAQRVERQLTDRSPAVMWGNYRKLFDPSTPEIFFANDPEGGRYVPSTLRPSNVVDAPWARMSLDRAELASLAAQAPTEVRARFAADGDSTVERLEFEYTSAAISRSWLATDVFASRAWQFTDPAKVLSNGADPPKGSCTAYVAGLVLARNVTVTKTAQGGGGTQTPPTVPIDLGFVRLAVRPVAAEAVVTAQPLVAEPLIAEPLIARAAGPETTVLRSVVRDHRVMGSVRRPRFEPPSSGGDIGPLELRQDRRVLMALDRLRLSDFERLPAIEPAPPEAPEAPPPGSITTPSDELYVLGFICKLLPKSPDPDPGLAW